MAHKVAVTPNRGLKTVLKVCRWWLAVIAGFVLLFVLGLITELNSPDWTIDPRRIPTDNLSRGGQIYYLITYATWSLVSGCLASSVAGASTRVAALTPGSLTLALFVYGAWRSLTPGDLPGILGVITGTICAWLVAHLRRRRAKQSDSP